MEGGEERLGGIACLWFVWVSGDKCRRIFFFGREEKGRDAMTYLD